MGAELPAMTSRHRHVCNSPRVCAKHNLRRMNCTFWSDICGSSMQQYAFPRPVSSECMFSFRLSGLCLVTWHTTCFGIAPPFAALHHGKTAGSGERCLNKDGGGGGGGGFFLACENFWRMFDSSFPACALFFLFFLLSGDYLPHTISPL